MSADEQMKHALTIDVEDYFHVAALAEVIKPEDWSNLSLRVEQNTHKILNLFDERGVQATFFVLGWVAERCPELVREIFRRGHEVASHGYSHQLVYKQTPAVFRQETTRSKALLEDIVQHPIRGYRAASYSITNESKWALDTLIELGFEYDSSIFPIRHDRYGIPDAPDYPHILHRNGGSIVEFPLSALNVLGYRLPVAGGGYFRLYPYKLTRLLLRQLVRQTGRPFIFYLHPWEIDPEQPRVNASRLSQFRHYNNLDVCEQRLQQLLQDFDFTSVADVLGTMGFDGGDGVPAASY